MPGPAGRAEYQSRYKARELPIWSEWRPSWLGRTPAWQEQGPWPKGIHPAWFDPSQPVIPGVWKGAMPPVVRVPGPEASAWAPYAIQVSPDLAARYGPEEESRAVQHELGHFDWDRTHPNANAQDSIEQELYAIRFSGEVPPYEFLHQPPGSAYYGMPMLQPKNRDVYGRIRLPGEAYGARPVWRELTQGEPLRNVDVDWNYQLAPNPGWQPPPEWQPRRVATGLPRGEPQFYSPLTERGLAMPYVYLEQQNAPGWWGYLSQGEWAPAYQMTEQGAAWMPPPKDMPMWMPAPVQWGRPQRSRAPWMPPVTRQEY